jgi:hypothetical protein
MPLINYSNLSKKPKPLLPGQLLDYLDDTAVVGGSASVPIELHMESYETTGPAGVDIVFLIDNSGSMKYDFPYSDPHGERFKTIKTLSAAFAPMRDLWDRIAIIIFQGNEAILIHSEDPWKRWSEIPAVVDELMQADPGGATPMEVGMKRATDLLAAQNGFYKLVILLSDGEPVPDNEIYPQTNIIIDQRVPEACANRVLYSTVYLRLPVPDNPQPQDSALLKYIALRTDYITRYDRAGDPPKYYFRIEQTAQMLQAYSELFNQISNRRVPQNVRLVEHINPRLLLDSQNPPEFSGNGFDPTQNVIGTHLDQALAQFVETGRFEIKLNELKGEAILRFDVKLDLETVTPQEFQNGYVLLPVDQESPESVDPSLLSWLEPQPTPAAGALPSGDLALPQAYIKFELGLQVIKTLEDNGGLVSIKIDNLDQSPVPWFELAEHPSGFINPVNFEDDFGFKPLAMLYEKRILPWFVGLIPPGVLPQSGAQRTRVLNAIRQALRQAHTPFLLLANQLDELLGQFSTFDFPGWANLNTFWCTRDVRGVYRLTESLPGKASRYLHFRVRDASFVKVGNAARLLEMPTDAVNEKQNERGLRPLSMYMAESWPESKAVPNIPRGQCAYPVGRPDLYVRTGLNGEKWRMFAPLFRGRSLGAGVTPWQFLSSPDITPFWQNQGQNVGVDVQVHNWGKTAPAGACLSVRTYFLPFTGVSTSPPYSSSPPLVGSATVNLPEIPHQEYDHESFVQHLIFAPLGKLGSAAASPIPVEPAFLQQVRQVLAVTVVEIDPAEGEVMLANNRAIEIVPVSCT